MDIRSSRLVEQHILLFFEISLEDSGDVLVCFGICVMPYDIQVYRYFFCFPIIFEPVGGSGEV